MAKSERGEFHFAFFWFLLVSCQWIPIVDSGNILALIASASPSHHIIHTTILKELAFRGHNVGHLNAFILFEFTDYSCV